MKCMFNYIYLSTLGSVKGDNVKARWNCKLTYIIETGGILHVTKHLNHAKSLMQCISNN